MKETFIIRITKRDKVYLSIIFCLVFSIICMAICLPRPYKVVETEVPVYVPQERRVYETKNVYIITTNSNLYDEETGYYQDINDNKYMLSFEENIIDSGDLEDLQVSINRVENGKNTKKTIKLENAIKNLIVFNDTGFGLTIKINQFIMLNIKNIFNTNLGANTIFIKDDFLLEFKFEKAEVNIIVSFISE